MARLVFDIETASLDRGHFDDAQWEYLFRDAERMSDDAARAARRTEIAQQLNLWPFTAQVVCVAMLNADTARGQVLFTAAEYEEIGDLTRRFSTCGRRCSTCPSRARNGWGTATRPIRIATSPSSLLSTG